MSPLSSDRSVMIHETCNDSKILDTSHSADLSRRLVILPSTTLFTEVRDVTVNALTESSTPTPTSSTAAMASSTDLNAITTATPVSGAIDSVCGGFTIYESSKTVNLACASSVACTWTYTKSHAYVYCPAPTPITTVLEPNAITKLEDCWLNGSGCCYHGQKAGALVDDGKTMWICLPDDLRSTIMSGSINDNIFLRSPRTNPAIRPTETSSPTTTTTTNSMPTAVTVVPVVSTASSTSTIAVAIAPTPASARISSKPKYRQATVMGASISVGVVVLAIVAIVVYLCRRYRQQRRYEAYQASKKRASSSNNSDTPILEDNFTGAGRTRPVFQKEGRTKYNIRHEVPMDPEPAWSEERKASLVEVQVPGLHELAELGYTPTHTTPPELPATPLPTLSKPNEKTSQDQSVKFQELHCYPPAPTPSSDPWIKYKDILARLGSKDREIFLGYEDRNRELIARMSRKQKEVFFRQSSPEQRREMLAIKAIGDERSPSGSLKGKHSPSLKVKTGVGRSGLNLQCPKKKTSMPEMRTPSGRMILEDFATEDVPSPLKGAKSLKRFASAEDVEKRMTTISEKVGE